MKNFKKDILSEDANSHGRPSFVFCVIALTNCAIEACEFMTPDIDSVTKLLQDGQVCTWHLNPHFLALTIYGY